MFYVQTTTYPRTHVRVAELPPGTRARDAFFVVEGAAIVHSKMHRHEKAQPYVLRGVSARGELLVETVNGSEYEPAGRLQTVDAGDTVEGYRFKRYVLKPITVLIKLALNANKTRRSVAKRQAEEDARRERVGTCPACFGDYVVRTSKGKDPVMVHHGYERPGHGYIVGDCHGVYHQPFEISCEGTKSFLAVLHMKLEQTELALKNLPTLTKISIEGYKDGRRCLVEITKDDRRFETTIQNKIHEYTLQQNTLKFHIKNVTQKIVEWQPQPWPRLPKSVD